MRRATSTLGQWFRQAAWAVALLAVLYLGADLLLPSAASPISQTSSFAATTVSETSPGSAAISFSQSSSSTARTPLQASIQQEAKTTPTYISELAPAVMVAPQQAATLPATGAESGANAPWTKLAGLTLALLGGLFIYTALTFHSSENG